MWYPLITESIVIMIQPRIHQLHTLLHVIILRDHVLNFGIYFAYIIAGQEN